MKREDFAAVASNYEAIGAAVDDLMVELAARLDVSHEQAAALSISALTRKFFPNYETDNSLTIVVELDEGKQLLVRDNPVLNSYGKPVEGEEGPLLLEVRGVATPFDNPVDAIIYSGMQSSSEED
jgi:hypothetical protein